MRVEADLKKCQDAANTDEVREAAGVCPLQAITVHE
jgi:ferredoxin